MQDTVKVTVCSGTACYVMGGSELLLLEEHIPVRWKNRVEIEGSPCLGLCKDRAFGKAPYAKIGDEIVQAATIPLLLEKIAEKLGG
jgi:NADH:ubiquinone oxidoreductase subunit E